MIPADWLSIQTNPGWYELMIRTWFPSPVASEDTGSDMKRRLIMKVVPTVFTVLPVFP